MTVTISDKARIAKAYAEEFERLEAEQLKIAKVQNYLVRKQMILATKSEAIAGALKKLLK